MNTGIQTKFKRGNQVELENRKEGKGRKEE